MVTPLVHRIEPGEGRGVLLITAHGDDMTLFLGGTVAAWSAAGWRVIVARVTDDRWDSVGVAEAQTIEANAQEFRAAAAILGVTEVVEFGYPTDTLGDVSEVALREQIIRQIRTHRPYALVSFDPYAAFGEDNQDHIKIAAATDESFWTSQFDKHHPEHLAAGLEPHWCFERWYFGREVQRVTDVIDISEHLETKVQAACAHRTMMLNFFNQLRLQARTGGWRIEAVDDALAAGDPAPLMRQLVRAGSEGVGNNYGVAAAEVFRIVRFGGLSALLERYGTPLT